MTARGKLGANSPHCMGSNMTFNSEQMGSIRYHNHNRPHLVLHGLSLQARPSSHGIDGTLDIRTPDRTRSAGKSRVLDIGTWLKKWHPADDLCRHPSPFLFPSKPLGEPELSPLRTMAG